MGKKKRIILAFCVLILLFLSFLCGAVFYYYRHPSKIKPLIESTISRSTGTRCTIKELSYSFKPLAVNAKEILLIPVERPDGFHLKIPDLRADMSLEGPLGHKSLVIKKLKAVGFSLQVSKALSLPQIGHEPETPSFLSQALRSFIAIFVFRDVTFQAAEVDGGQVSAQLGDQSIQLSGIHAHLNSDHRLDVSCSAQVQWPSKQMRFNAPSLEITTDHALSLPAPQIKGLLKVQNATFESPEAAVKNAALHLKFIYEHPDKTLNFEPLEAQLQDIALKQVPGTIGADLAVDLKTVGVVHLQDRKVNASHCELNLKDLLQCKGSLDVVFGDQTRVDLRNLEGYLVPQKLLSHLPDSMKGRVGPLELSGPIRLTGNIQGSKDPGPWQWLWDLTGQFLENRFSYSTDQIRVHSRISGHIQAKGTFPDVKVSLRLAGNQTSLSTEGIALKPFDIRSSLSGKFPVFDIQDLVLQVPEAKFRTGKREILIEDIRAQLRNGMLNVVNKTLWLPDVELSTSLLDNLRVSMEVGENELVMTLKGKDTRLIESAMALNLIPAGWRFSGIDSIQAGATLKNKRDLIVTSKFSLNGLGFENKEGNAMGEAITLHAEVNGRANLRGSRVAASISLEAIGGEILYDRFYIDLSKNAIFSAWQGEYDISKKSLQISKLKLKLKDILSLDIQGEVLREAEENRVLLLVNIPVTAFNPAFRHLILEPYRREKPFLSRLNLKGAISGNLELNGYGTDWALTGHFFWHDGELVTSDETLSLRGIELDLPLWYQTKVKSEKSQVTSAKQEPSLVAPHPSLQEVRVHGKLSIRSMTLPPLPSQSLAIPLNAGPNRLSILSPTLLRFPGGEVEVGPLVCKELYPPLPAIVTSLKLKKVDLNPLLSRIWPRPVEGLIQGELDPVTLEGSTLRTEGEMRANAFGGKILLSRLGGTGILTSAPLFHLDANWNDLHLAELTKETSFGKVEGILEGYIKNLEIAYGQPQRFDLFMETVKRKGVPQKISVRAIDNIARIGGGQSPFVGFAGMLTSFFKEFPYEKIGVRASLENDVFRINGTIKEGGKEYLVKRGGFSGVNVVNQNPDNPIRFKDMVKTIKRVTSSRSGPVVR